MHGPADDPLIARIAAELRRPMPAPPDFDARVMGAVRRAPPPPAARAWAWLREPRTVAVSPLGALAAAAGLAALLIAGAWSLARSRAAGSAPRVAAAAAPGAPSLVTFVFMAPAARTVAVAGDFDNWDRTLLPMRRDASGLWRLDVPLAPGRYQYAFVVDGRRFVADPAAPPALGDDFGQPTSVVTVAGAASGTTGGSL
jgi:hypothetical protein